LKLGQVNANHIAVDEHLPGVPAEIIRAELLHFFLNQRLFLWRYPDDKLLCSGSVLQIGSSPLLCGLGFLRRVWAAPNKHKLAKGYPFAVLALRKTAVSSVLNLYGFVTV